MATLGTGIGFFFDAKLCKQTAVLGVDLERACAPGVFAGFLHMEIVPCFSFSDGNAYGILKPVMTTITINEELGIERNSFKSLSELLTYLEEHGLMIGLHELSENEVTNDMRKKAKEAAKEYREHPSSFSRL